LAGENVEYRGVKDSKNGWIKCEFALHRWDPADQITAYGQQWWDANPANGTGIANRPHLMNFRVNNGLIADFKSWKPIAW
jgi:hypothetical protein